ncbi:hypothetical protein SKAU_G00289700 [Synaphobranchus kaupii]|uniref:Uncharacterized protein n=1 Tax=Synaphobranchus kaupii TaxID=118154 RepID=A0A9Q1ETI0_SYNKA|nr:hypothetical protein SKAU_G00289700 [Synaphobranchus kaupii]
MGDDSWQTAETSEGDVNDRMCTLEWDPVSGKSQEALRRGCRQTLLGLRLNYPFLPGRDGVEKIKYKSEGDGGTGVRLSRAKGVAMCRSGLRPHLAKACQSWETQRTAAAAQAKLKALKRSQLPIIACLPGATKPVSSSQLLSKGMLRLMGLP